MINGLHLSRADLETINYRVVCGSHDVVVYGLTNAQNEADELAKEYGQNAYVSLVNHIYVGEP